MKTIATTLTLVALLLVASLVFVVFGGDAGARLTWQGALVVLGVGAVAFALRFVPAGPWNLDRVDGSAFDDPESFWGRAARFYRES